MRTRLNEPRADPRAGYWTLHRAARGRALSRATRDGQEPLGASHRSRGNPAGLPRHLSRSAYAPRGDRRRDAGRDRKAYFADLAAVPLLIIDDLGMRKLPHTAA